jgi:hypothetical protein
MHIDDQAALYAQVLSSLLRLEAPYGKKGFYFSENGTFSWRDLSLAILNTLRKRNNLDVVDTLPLASEEDLIAIGKVLECNVGMVPVSLAGK